MILSSYSFTCSINFLMLEWRGPALGELCSKGNTILTSPYYVKNLVTRGVVVYSVKAYEARKPRYTRMLFPAN